MQKRATTMLFPLFSRNTCFFSNVNNSFYCFTFLNIDAVNTKIAFRLLIRRRPPYIISLRISKQCSIFRYSW